MTVAERIFIQPPCENHAMSLSKYLQILDVGLERASKMILIISIPIIRHGQIWWIETVAWSSLQPLALCVCN